ncbi:hypothetical protein ACFX19_040740 [Malus domestica]
MSLVRQSRRATSYPACYVAPEKDNAVPVICNNCVNVKVDQPPGNYNSRRAETQLKQGGMKVEENMTSDVNNEGMDGIFWGEHEREFSGV